LRTHGTSTRFISGGRWDSSRICFEEPAGHSGFNNSMNEYSSTVALAAAICFARGTRAAHRGAHPKKPAFGPAQPQRRSEAVARRVPIRSWRVDSWRKRIVQTQPDVVGRQKLEGGA